ncbi:MAG: diguanylate cyclase [Phycisphaeraceae bacterium]
MKPFAEQLLRGITAKPAADPTTDRALMARIGAALFGAGATLTLVWLLSFDQPAGSNEQGLVAQIVTSYVTAALVLVAYKRATWWTYQLFSVWATLVITAGIYFAGENVAISALFYVWVNEFSFYFYSRVQAVAQLAFIGLCYGVTLVLQAPPDIFTRWIITMGTLIVAGVLVSALRGRVQHLVERLAEAANTDHLTGLLNRRAFDEVLDRELERARRSASQLSLLVCDLDHFKQVNDRLGHQKGDVALERLSAVLNETKRRIDTTARMGGEEFALVLPETDPQGASMLAERVRTAVKRSFEADPVPFTMSIGVASFPNHGRTPDALLGAADQALYAAKALGRNCTVIHDPDAARHLEALAQGSEADEYLSSVLRLADTLGIRDAQAARHCERVGHYSEMTARALGLAPDVAERVRLAGVLHDVGTASVPESIMRKEGPLDEEEWAAIRKHPEAGARILGAVGLDEVRDTVLAHQERVDGSGYPRGQRGEEIPLEARILAVADAYEAMTSGRPYKPALGPQEAGEQLLQGAGTQFDRRVVEAFLGALEREGAGDTPKAA